MNEFLANPAIQAIAVPFVVAAAAALLFKRTGPYATGLAMLAGFFVAVAIIAGITLPPRTSTQKIIVAGLACVPLAALFDWRSRDAGYVRYAAVTIGAAAVLWVIWPVAARQAGTEFWLLVIGGVAYGAWLVGAMDSLQQRPEQALSAAVALGFGTGGAALFGASALLGQLGLALGAAASVLALLHLLTLGQTAGRLVTLPVGILAGLLGYAAMVFSKLPWPALLLLAAIPLLGQLPLSNLNRRLQMFLGGLVGLIAAGAAVFVTWKSAGSLYA